LAVLQLTTPSVSSERKIVAINVRKQAEFNMDWKMCAFAERSCDVNYSELLWDKFTWRACTYHEWTSQGVIL